ncbi:hypothetical protein HNR12_002838 [Streptomonospora nanhaiensis]|uniref:Mce-associated membrane protein n=1 Tax=Streptomonospora nanhaiensis TaxID=1323731 RepID=A0A853BPX0_9ACTN|nr:hypothetical protein [Streptomonospora nanhaiensis]NYI96561.1 hypothetical protein [Streptomonospora nanhaiensis]
MSEFTGGTSRERVLVTAIIVTLVAAAVFLYVQLTGGDDPDEGSNSADSSGTSGGAAEGDRPVGDVMALLPHTEEQLSAGAEVARDFVAAYATYDPDEDPQERMDRVTPLVGEDFVGQLETLMLSPPTAGSRQDAPATTASAEVVEIRNVGSESVIFVVDANLSAETGGAGETQTASYAVTVVPENGEWRVYGFQDASLGDAGVP